MFEGLLDNILFMIVPLLIYQMIWVDRGLLGKKGSKAFMVVISAISIALCMFFPTSIPQNVMLNMKYLPVISTVLYGGPLNALSLGVVILGLSFFTNNESSLLIILTIFIILAITMPFKKVYFSLIIQNKMILAGGLSILISLIHSAAIFATTKFSLHLLGCILLFTAMQAITLWLMTYIYEKIGQFAILKKQISNIENLKVISELASSTSHDIRNPLTVTKGILQLMRYDDYSKEKKAELTQLAIDELAHAETIINDYLAITKAQLDLNSHINLSEITQRAVNVIKPYANINNIEIKSSIDRHIFIMGNGSHLYRAIINLAKNGIEAMRERGILSVHLTTVEKEAVLVISDTGIGMTNEEIRRLGTPYYTTKEKGTGIGTMVVFHFIQSMNGKIDVKSQKGKGTQFIIRFQTIQKENLV